MTRTLIHFNRICFTYGENGWNLSIPELELGNERITCIVGPNGSGKSTLLRLAAGILTPLGGSIRLGDALLPGMSRRSIARCIGFLPQETPPLFDYTVKMITTMGRYPHSSWVGTLTDTDRQAICAALNAVDMHELQNRPLSHLSGGERRRAMIAAVLAQQPQLMLLDEPTASLDIHHAAAVMRLIAGFENNGPRVVLVTHDINLAALFADRLIMLHAGRIAADGPPAEVITPELMEQTYGEDLLVRAHPESGVPMVVARRAEKRQEGNQS